MSTPDTPETPALTRRQLRELRQTGATPIITPNDEPEVPDAAAPAVGGEAPAVIDAVPAPEPEKPAEKATPEPEKSAEEAAPMATPDPATPAAFDSYSEAGAEFGVSGLTRRQAREQEKIRTASVPIISPDLEPSPSVVGSAPKTADEAQPAIFRPAPAAETPAQTPAPAPSVVNPALGSELINGATPDVTLPASFDQLLARTTGATGTVSTPNSLILSQTPSGAPLVGPVTATGEIMITGTFDLPEGLGSVGHAPGTTDGRDADAVLLDGELPAASSPTPIAASAAISTVKQPGEIIRPPAPEKGSKLLVGLIITTGALFLAVVATLGLAFTTGVFR
ncbi:hypothetical protein [Microbacterium sp. VKM Ac-2923]|uniref:hypothetical protein n=1 Tax=Microbacterium sp. VKM Ac-2923 TaxID=2929476 RepID=UPI001FB55D26|nr:hypothetical protein [Microbacterium sp. VKM Ac-2923]MCJ1707490.1 hypothetical protein [Microbacterium sp. VKM Ac-2923]